MDIKKSRAEIDKMNRELVSLFCRRMDTAENIARYKLENDMPVFDRARERDILADMTQLSDEKYRYYTKTFFTVMMDLSKAYQSSLIAQSQNDGDEGISARIAEAEKNTPPIFPDGGLIACQGVEGAYSQKACDKLFSLPKIKYFGSFGEVFAAVETGECDFGILPIENSTYGTVNEVYDLMQRYNFCIVRSLKLKIEHKLLCVKGATLEGITDVYSHSQALGQCNRFFEAHPNIRLHICANTAVAAKTVAEMNDPHVAAISSADCAGLYGLSVLPCEIQNTSYNYTRFICISKGLSIYPGANKISLMLTLRHEPGSLYTTLSKFTAQALNLTKLESRPIEGSDFDARFYFDFEASPDEKRVKQLLDDLERNCDSLTFLGGYTEKC
ncbi:MAG: chorismate mutase [Clostridia bacterium]|nr:chorismate mutase [Clostridia bacterium]